ncbi:MAG: hypothetical protein FWG25_10915, partial [Promicromonosporaceae bacterium]|nr:hypothetical protein [Promicromonosporaceae bacterium]
NNGPMRPIEPNPAAVDRILKRQEGLITRRQATSLGVSDPKVQRNVRNGTWIRLAQGVYDTNSVPVSERHEMPDFHTHWRRRSAILGLLVGGPGAVAYGQAALTLLNVSGLPPMIPAEIMVPNPENRKSAAGVLFHQLEIALEDTKPVESWLCPPVKLAMAQAMCGLSVGFAVAVLDNALNQKRLFPTDLPEIRQLMSGRRGAAGVHRCFQLADGRAESPLESLARLDCVEAGVPPDALQLEIRTERGQFLGRVDLAWRLKNGKYLVLEVDGKDIHSTPTALYRDRERANDLQLAGHVVLRVTARELWTQGAVAALVRKALAKHGRWGG